MRVLVVGGGAREHAICEAVKNSEETNLFSVMKNKNPGIEKIAKDYLLENETNIENVVKYAKQNKIELALIGPEAPLEIGLTDLFLKNKIPTCAPTKAAARIETDKEWMRNIVEKYNIPGQLKYNTFNQADDARKYISELNSEVVLKPIGLTGGKGVKVAGDHFNGINEAMSYVDEVISEKIGGVSKILVEEKAVGEEFTVQALSDGSNIVVFPAVQDHKRLLPDDRGPNTGGMGSYSCSNGLLPFLSKDDYDKGVLILKKLINALKEEDCEYIGPIYGQFMLTSDGVKIIEINARFGDPENMNVLPLLKSDYVNLSQSIIEGNLREKNVKFERKSTVCKYVVPEGYGYKSKVGEKIHVDEELLKNTGARLFYASVNKKNNDIYTTSSRSLAVVGVSEDLPIAERTCEEALNHVKGEHIFIRHDIGTSDLIKKRIDNISKLRGK
jgi:phosphoribosylamine--glycine ligase